MTVDAYVKHANALLALSSEADGLLRRQQTSAQQAARRAAAELEGERRRLGELRARLEVALQRAIDEGALARRPAATAVDPGADPLDRLDQLCERLEGAIADAAHTRRALEAERAREHEQQRARAEQERRRRAEREAREQAERRRARRIDRGAIAVAATATAAAAATAAVGVVAAAVPAAAVALGSGGLALWRRRAHRT